MGDVVAAVLGAEYGGPVVSDFYGAYNQHAVLHRWSAPWVKKPVSQRVLSERIERFLPELFVFVADPRVPATENAAERALRPLVISRATRLPAGSTTKTPLASLFGT